MQEYEHNMTNLLSYYEQYLQQMTSEMCDYYLYVEADKVYMYLMSLLQLMAPFFECQPVDPLLTAQIAGRMQRQHPAFSRSTRQLLEAL